MVFDEMDYNRYKVIYSVDNIPRNIEYAAFTEDDCNMEFNGNKCIDMHELDTVPECMREVADSIEIMDYAVDGEKEKCIELLKKKCHLLPGEGFIKLSMILLRIIHDPSGFSNGREHSWIFQNAAQYRSDTDEVKWETNPLKDIMDIIGMTEDLGMSKEEIDEIMDDLRSHFYIGNYSEMTNVPTPFVPDPATIEIFDIIDPDSRDITQHIFMGRMGYPVVDSNTGVVISQQFAKASDEAKSLAKDLKNMVDSSGKFDADVFMKRFQEILGNFESISDGDYFVDKSDK